MRYAGAFCGTGDVRFGADDALVLPRGAPRYLVTFAISYKKMRHVLSN